MEAPAILLMSTDDESEFERIKMLDAHGGVIDGIPQAVRNDLVTVGLLEAQDSDSALFKFDLDAGSIEIAVRHCQILNQALPNTRLWCYANTGDAVECYIKAFRDDFVQEVVNSDGGDAGNLPTDFYEQWHKGLPEDLNYGCLATSDAQELFSSISNALQDGQPITDFIPRIAIVDNVNFVTSYNEDAFTYVFDYGRLESEADTLGALRAIVNAGYDVNRILNGEPVIVRAARTRTRSPEAYATKLTVLRELLDSGVDVEFVSLDNSFDEAHEVTPLAECAARDEGYYTLLNHIAAFEEAEPTYAALLPYCSTALLNAALSFQTRWEPRFGIPDGIISQMRTRLAAG